MKKPRNPQNKFETTFYEKKNLKNYKSQVFMKNLNFIKKRVKMV